MSADYIKAIGLNAVVANGGKHPFSALNPIRLSSAGAAVVHGVNRSQTRTPYNLRIDGDGATTVWDEDDIPYLSNAIYQATLTAANYLEVVATANGVPLTRVDDLATPGAGEFKIDQSGTGNTITFGDTHAVGTVLRVYLATAVGATLDDGSADPKAVVEVSAGLTANVPVQAESYDFMRATTAAATIEAVPGTC